MLIVLWFEPSCPHTANPGSWKPRLKHTSLLSKRNWKEELGLSSSVVQRTTIFRAALLLHTDPQSLGADARTTSQPRPYPCCHRPRTRYRLPADDCNPHKHQVRAYTTTNSTQARPPPGDQRPHGGDHIDRSSRTPPSARQATTHGAIVDMSLTCTRPTTTSLTSPCSSSDPRGQRGRDRRRRPTCTTYVGTRRGRRGCIPPSAERTACRISTCS